MPARSPVVDVAIFDPYAAAIPLRWMQKVPTAALLLLAPLVAGLLITSAAVSGLLTDGGALEPIKDFWRAVGRNDLKITDELRYPLMRDAPVWLFAAIMIAELMIMKRQWRLFATCIPKLVANKVIKPRPDSEAADPDDPPILRWAKQFPPEQRLAKYVERANEHNRKLARLYTAVFAVSALALSALLVWGERYGLFRILVPADASPADQERWRRDAYAHWWASLDHPIGAITYFLLAALAIYVILAQTHVGVHIARIAAALPRLVQLDANWINPDGHYGWEPLRQIFRSVWVSMALYGDHGVRPGRGPRARQRRLDPGRVLVCVAVAVHRAALARYPQDRDRRAGAAHRGGAGRGRGCVDPGAGRARGAGAALPQGSHPAHAAGQLRPHPGAAVRGAASAAQPDPAVCGEAVQPIASSGWKSTSG